MDYMWNEFNIKTFPAETVVYRDGFFDPNLSTLKSTIINKKHKLPVHIIYIGEIKDDNNLEIEVNTPDTKVFLTVKVINKKPAFLNIFIKNAGENSSVLGKIILQNYSDLSLNNQGLHLGKNTTIVMQTKLVAHSESLSKLIGIAKIEKNYENCISDIGFSALASKNAKIEFFPAQFISSTPKSAEHSASLYQGSDKQIEFLKESGLSSLETTKVLEEAFINDFDLF